MRSGLFVRGSLPEEIMGMYRAAGVIPHTREKSWFLLGRDHRRKEPVWSHFGGKREDADLNDPEQTALREFAEEIEPLGARNWQPEIRDDDPIVWTPSGKYLTYFVEIPDSTTVDATLTFEDSNEKTGFAWVRASELLEACRNRELELDAYNTPSDSNAVARVKMFPSSPVS